MKEKYIKYKKLIRSFLGFGTTVAVIGLFLLFSKSYILGIVLMVVGIGIVIGAGFIKKATIKIEEYSKTKCPVCGKDVVYSTETRYYIANNLVEEEDFNNENVNYDRVKKVIHYYKCEECHFCLTVIEQYVITFKKEKRLNDFVNMDFNYDGSY